MRPRNPYKIAGIVVFVIGSTLVGLGIAGHLELLVGGLFLQVVALLIRSIGNVSSWRRDWRRSTMPLGHCRNCGYNLKGNESGACSECGEPISGQPDT